jgi:glyoxylase-like metal-dependent hydrolase (beta-lactamase superfamily II)
MADMTPSAEFGPVRIYFGHQSGKYPDGNQVIVQGSDSRAVFDSPLVSHRIGEDFDQADLAIQGHIHEDHTAGLVRLPHTPVYTHQADLAAIQSWQGCEAAFGYDDKTWEAQKRYMLEKFSFVLRPDAIGFDDDAEWDLGGGVKVRAIHMPGHTSGHCVLLVEPVGLAFLGDIELSGFGPYYGDHTSSLTEMRRTLNRLPEIPADIWVTSHHRGIYTDRASMLQDLHAFESKIEMRRQKILGLLRDGQQTLKELVDQRVLWPDGYEAFWVEATERNTIARHLDELITNGDVSVNEVGVYSL